MLHYLAAAITVASSFAAVGDSQWQNDYGKALEATRSDQRPLLVVLDIPSDPKSSLAANLLDAQGNAAKSLEPYRVCHVDASTEYGRKVAEAFHATTFPHTAIIDKTGAVVIYKKPGQIADGEWQEMLVKYQSGDRAVEQTVFYRGDASVYSGTSGLSNSSYCPSCQRKAMGL